MQRKFVLLASDGTSHDLSRRVVFSETVFDLPDLLDQGWCPVRETAIGQGPFYRPDGFPLGVYSVALVLLEREEPATGFWKAGVGQGKLRAET
jgi:hypothetical protein